MVFKEGHFIQDNMNRALLNKEDIMQEVRKSALTGDLSKIREIYLERSGEISIVEDNQVPENL